MISEVCFIPMAFPDFFTTLSVVVTLFISFYFYLKIRNIWNKSVLPINWPFLGMLPAAIQDFHRILDSVTDGLIEIGGTGWFRGPWFSGSDILITSDPSNLHHILSKNFSNYPKSPDFREIFAVFGDGIINAEPKLWELERRTIMSFFTNKNFHLLLEKTTWNKISTGFLPVLKNLCFLKAEFDLQDLFQRFAFDSSVILASDQDPGSLSINLPRVPCEKAFNDVVAACWLRYLWPRSFWKLQRWLGIGKEKKLMEAWSDIDAFLYPCISMKLEELGKEVPGSEAGNFSFLACFLKGFEGTSYLAANSRKFIRDTFAAFILGGRDTTSTTLAWLFYLLSQNPEAESKILDELKSKFNLKDENNLGMFSSEESRHLVYLHGALCETLRLFPPVSWQNHSPVKPDVLPSGHHIGANAKVLLSYYVMGRMEAIWGKDCMEFRPERWISERGDIKSVPSYKFPAFNAGPRSCLGKEMAFIQMKMVVASILFKYKIQVVEDHPVSPGPFIMIQMTHGLKVRLTKRDF